jgi:hypothetical protein
MPFTNIFRGMGDEVLLMKNKDVKKISLRGGFSDRMGIQKINQTLQVKDFDERTRVFLSNYFLTIIDELGENFYVDDWATSLYLHMMCHVYVEQVSPHNLQATFALREIEDKIHDTIMNGEYDDVLTIIEYITGKIEDIYKENGEKRDLQETFNTIFQREFVGYRFVNGLITPITDETEMSSVAEAMTLEFDNVSKHINKALMHLSNRVNPDYENSIKESISAVEAMCVRIVNNDNATLGEALKKLESEGAVNIHPAMKAAFEKLYGYTSDDDSGIRHAAGMGGENASFEEAKYMLVTCSAFINYLKPLMNGR